MMIKRRPLVARLSHWTGNATIGVGAVAVLLTALAGLASLVLVSGAAARLLTDWWKNCPR